MQQLRAQAHRVDHALFEALRRAFVDHRADIGFGVHRVAGFELLGVDHDALDQLVGDAFDREDALHGRAALARILGRPGDGEFGGLVGIGIVEHDQRIVAAEFEHHAAIAGLLRDHLADRDRARERDEIDIRIGDHRVAQIAGRTGDDRQHFGRQARFVKNVGECECRQRRQFRRLQHHAVIGRDRGRDLVRHHIERVVERRDRRDDALQRLAQRMDAARLAVRGDVAGERLGVLADRELARQRINVVGASHFVIRNPSGSSRFRR